MTKERYEFWTSTIERFENTKGWAPYRRLDLLDFLTWLGRRRQDNNSGRVEYSLLTFYVMQFIRDSKSLSIKDFKEFVGRLFSIED